MAVDSQFGPEWVSVFWAYNLRGSPRGSGPAAVREKQSRYAAATLKMYMFEEGGNSLDREMCTEKGNIKRLFDGAKDAGVFAKLL